MSHTEQIEAAGSAWSYLLVAVLFFAGPLAFTWLGMHGGQHLLIVLRRGHEYRQRIRRARHRQRRDSLHHLTYRSPVR